MQRYQRRLQCAGIEPDVAVDMPQSQDLRTFLLWIDKLYSNSKLLEADFRHNERQPVT